jgi:hypothetical protein
LPFIHRTGPPGRPLTRPRVPGDHQEQGVVQVRDKRFIAEHRGGPLPRECHYQLMQWARDCSRHVLPLCGEAVDRRLRAALDIAMEWTRGNASVGEARKASLGAIAAANESPDRTAVAVARSVGHAAATAHMADHSLGAAWYALKAVKSAGRPVEAERRWQDRHLPRGIRELVLSARQSRHI